MIDTIISFFQLSYELLKRNSPPYDWRDAFAAETLAILAQHAVQARDLMLLIKL